MIYKSVKFLAGCVAPVAIRQATRQSISIVSAVQRKNYSIMAASNSLQFRPVVMSGPSGSGKSTLVKMLMAEFKDCFAFSVSHTTRSPRPGEVDGKDYYFVTNEEMDKAITNNEFIEHASFSGNSYGTSKKAVENVVKTGRICILDIDMQGVKNIKKTDLKPRFIFVKPPSMKVLEERLRGRGTETEESLQKRLAACQAEMDYALEKGAYDHIVVNENKEIAYEKLKGILIKDIDVFIKDRHKAH